MKKFLVLGLAMLVMAGCSDDLGMSVPPKKDASLCEIYKMNGWQGIVVQTNTGSQKGLLLSIEETGGTWAEANAWAASLGGSWRLPTVEELQAIYNIIDDLNESLSKSGKKVVKSDFYWTSDEYRYDDSKAWRVYMGYGGSSNYNKLEKHYVRAVAGF